MAVQLIHDDMFPGRSKRFFSLLRNVQTGVVAHSASYLMGTGGSFFEVKQPGCEGEHSPQSSTEIKNEWSSTSTTPHAFISC
jgi:hypothetical protein